MLYLNDWSYEHAHFIETSGQQDFILPHWGVACYSEGFTSPWTVYRASNEARDIHWKHLRVSHMALTSCSDLHFNIQFIESAHFFYSLVWIFRLLIIPEYLLEIKIFIAFIRSNVLVEKLTNVLKDKHFALSRLNAWNIDTLNFIYPDHDN